MKNFSHTIKISKSFDETVALLSEKIENAKFKILYIHDVQKTFATKGIKHGNYKIIEFCRAPAAKIVLDADPMIGLLLPCKAIVFTENGKTVISAMSPKITRDIFPNAKVGDLPEQIDAEIAEIIQNLNS